MKYSTGIFDGLFGKKSALQMRQQDGTMKAIPVTEAWLTKMETEGKISLSKVVPCHVTGCDGPEKCYLEVGKDIPEAQYRRLADPKTGDLYGLKVYTEGIPKLTVIEKAMWELSNAQWEESDREFEVLTKKYNARLKAL